MRKDVKVAQSEYDNFVEFSGLHPSQLKAQNLYIEPKIEEKILREYDGFLIGGLSDDPSDSLVINSHYFPFIDDLENLLRFAVEHRIPGILSCGGFMLGTKLLGGSLTLEPSRQEMDILEISLTDEAKSDVLFENFPLSFQIVSGHLKSALDLPRNAYLLASSVHCPIHAWKIKGAPLYAFQGHPEITAANLKERVEPYKKKYFSSKAEYLRFLKSDQDTSVANSILSRFIEILSLSKFVQS